MKQILSAFCLLPLFATTVLAQEQNINVVNVLNNNPSLNVRNINVSIPTGPNGPGGNVYQEVNINLSDNILRPNIGGPNMQGFTSSVVPKQTASRQVVNRPKPAVVTNKPKPKPSPLVASAATRRPKPTPKPNTVAATQNRRPARPVVQAAPVPVVAPPVITAPPVQIQAASVINMPVVQADNNVPVVQQAAMNNDIAIQTTVAAPSAAMAGTSAARRSTSSAGSGSSSGTHRSKSKKHGSFSYHTSKKLKQLFAHNRKGKFDPAKCFVWN